MKAKDLLNQKIVDLNIDDSNLPHDINELIQELQVHQIELEMQNEELMKNQIELQTSKTKYFELYNYAPCSYFTLDSNGLIMDVNFAATTLLGIEKIYLINRAFIQFVNLDSRYKFTKLIENVIGNEKILKCQLELLNGKTPFPVIMEINSNIYSADNIKSILITVVNISELKKAEKQVKKSLEEKEVLLKEINHRVKNNLQIIASLLHLQEGRTDDDEALNVLRESQGRVNSMAMVQENLSQSTAYSHINLREYVEKLVYDILYSYGTNETIKTNLNIEDINLNIDTAIPLGLIINELVTNIVKYAFNGSDGNLTIKIKSRSEKIEIIIADDGVGMPEDIEPENLDTLGLQVVNSLVKQLDGNIRLNRSNGTHYTIDLNK